MNRSWNNSSNSPGFVYFNQTPTKNPSDTTEFLSFGDSTPSPKLNHKFSPSHYGSPQFHSSPRKFNLRNTYRHSGGNQGNRSFNRNSSNNSYSPNNSFNNSNYNNSRGNHKYTNNYNKSKNINVDGKSDISHYYDHTCTMDPWADLQKEHDKRREEEEAKQQSLAEDKQDNSASSSSDESDSEESEESPAISSMAEDETT